MKISADRLREIVKEEMSVSMSNLDGGHSDMMGGETPHLDTDGEGYMAKQNLWKIAEYAAKLYEMLDDSDNLEPWVEEKIAIASFLMDSVGHYIEYAKHREEENMGGGVVAIALPDTGEEMPSDDEEGEEEMYEFEPDEDEEYGDEENEDEGEEEYEDEEGGEERR